jgi:hypothetical protein
LAPLALAGNDQIWDADFAECADKNKNLRSSAQSASDFLFRLNHHPVNVGRASCLVKNLTGFAFQNQDKYHSPISGVGFTLNP